MSLVALGSLCIIAIVLGTVLGQRGERMGFWVVWCLGAWGPMDHGQTKLVFVLFCLEFLETVHLSGWSRHLGVCLLEGSHGTGEF